MTEPLGPLTTYIPPSEPTEAAVLRAVLARWDAEAEDAARYGDKMLYREKAALQRLRTEANALRFAIEVCEANEWRLPHPLEAG